jgi:hypothetical protein
VFVVVHYMCVTAQCSFNFPPKLSIGISCYYPRDIKNNDGFEDVVYL